MSRPAVDYSLPPGITQPGRMRGKYMAHRNRGGGQTQGRRIQDVGEERVLDEAAALAGILSALRWRYKGDTLIEYTEFIYKLATQRQAMPDLLALARRIQKDETQPEKLRKHAGRALAKAAPPANPEVGDV